MSTYATTATIEDIDGIEVLVSRNLMETVNGDVVRLDLLNVSDNDPGINTYLTRDQAVALGLAILEAALPDLAQQVDNLGTAYVRVERHPDEPHRLTVLDTTTVVERIA